MLAAAAAATFGGSALEASPTVGADARGALPSSPGPQPRSLPRTTKSPNVIFSTLLILHPPSSLL